MRKRLLLCSAALLVLFAISAMPSHAQCPPTGASGTPYLVFGPQAVGQTGLTQTATVTFTTGCPGNTTITINSITMSGANAGDFTPEGPTDGGCNDAALTFGPGSISCTLGATFTPSALGTETALETINWSSNNPVGFAATTTVNLIGGDEIVYVTTGVGGQVLTVDATTGAFQILSNAPICAGVPCAFNPTGAVVGPDAKIYITDSLNNNIWRMNQDGSLPEVVYSFASCTAAQEPSCPVQKPEGPSFSASGNGDLYFNTFENGEGLFAIFGAATTPVGGTFSSPVNVEPGTCDGCGGNGFPFGGTGSAFDANGNLLAGDQEDSEIWSLAPPYDASVSAPAAVLNSGTSTVGVSSGVLGIALDKANGQTYFAQYNGAQNQVVQIVPPVGTGPYTTTPYYTFTSTNPGCEVNDAQQPDLPEYIAFDMTGRLFVATSTGPLNIGSLPSRNGCGRVSRVDPGASPTATLLLDLSAVNTNGIAGVCSAPCGLNSTQAIGLAMPPTQSAPQFFSLPAGGGSVTAGWPNSPACTPPNPPTSSTPPLPPGCSITITGTWPAGIFTNPNDMLEVIWMDKTQAELAAEKATTNYGDMRIMGAPVQGYGKDTIVASLQCVNTVNGTNGMCNDSVTQGESYQMFSTWQSPQTDFCANPGGISGGTTYFFRGEPALDLPYASLENDFLSCADGQPGQKAQSSCSSSSSSSCLSRWWDGYGPATSPTVTATIMSPGSGITFTLNQPATTTFSCSPSTTPPLVAGGCSGSVTQPDGTLVSVSSGGALPTSQGGTFTLTVNPQADSGSGVSASVQYNVQNTFQFIGFDAPITNSPTLNVAQAGQAIPVAFQVLFANGIPDTNLTMPPVSIVFDPAPCTDLDTTSATTIPADASGNSGFQNLGDGNYQFVWKTPKSLSGTCGQLQVNLGDGVLHTADFKFK